MQVPLATRGRAPGSTCSRSASMEKEKESQSAFQRLFRKDQTVITSESTAEEVKVVYDEWAESYDRDMAKHRFVAYEAASAFFADASDALNKRKDTRIIDVGAGTGLLGGSLHARGFTNIEAYDMSQEMLNVASRKEVYAKLTCGTVGGEHSIGVVDDFYDGLVCMACLAAGHVGAEALEEFVRIVKPGGLMLLSIKRPTIDGDELDYHSTIKRLVAQGLITITSRREEEYYLDDVVNDDFKKCYLYMCQVTK